MSKPITPAQIALARRIRNNADVPDDVCLEIFDAMLAAAERLHEVEAECERMLTTEPPTLMAIRRTTLLQVLDLIRRGE